jgi:hypothetical protein
MRKQMSRSGSKRSFRKGTAVKKVNHKTAMGRRGGIRL